MFQDNIKNYKKRHIFCKTTRGGGGVKLSTPPVKQHGGEGVSNCPPHPPTPNPPSRFKVKAVTKWYLTHYSSLIIIWFKWIYVGLYLLRILLNTSFPTFCAFCVFCFESNVLNQDLKRICYH